MIKLKAIGFSAVLLLSISNLCYAQLGVKAPVPNIAKSDGPSLEETKQWILQKLAITHPPSVTTSIPGSMTMRERIRWRIAFHDCDLFYGREEIHWLSSISGEVPPETPSGGDTKIEIYIVPLINMDENASGGDSPYVGLHITGERALVVNRTIFVSALLEAGYRVMADLDSFNTQIEKLQGFQAVSAAFAAYSNPSASWATQVSDAEDAAHVRLAFNHAISLCKRQAADAKAAANAARPKELF